MKNGLTLIATLPTMNNLAKVEEVFKNPFISEVRLNSGVQNAYSAKEAMCILKRFSEKYQKKLWVDVKGRQLKVIKWADPLYSCIELNHNVQVTAPAKVYFRNGDRVNIMHIKDGNKLFVDPLPRQALGAGQSINIIADDVIVDGYLTEKDREYLNVCKEIGHNYVMASFVESYDDFKEILQILPKAQIVSKIESLKGVEFISNNKLSNLMVARDDLYLQSGEGYSMINHLKSIIKKDKNAICASRIFLSLEKRETPDFADFADLELMYSLGYRRFMLCDNVCNYAFDRAIKAWKEFINE